MGCHGNFIRFIRKIRNGHSFTLGFKPSPPENRGSPFSRSPPPKKKKNANPPPFSLMLSRVNPKTFHFFVLFVLDDAILLPKHKYENLILPEMRTPDRKQNI